MTSAIATQHLAHIVLPPTGLTPRALVISESAPGAARVTATYRLGAYAAVGDARLRLAEEGWRVVGEPEQLTDLPGYHLVAVEPVEED